MLELKIHCNCRVCGSPVVIESINHTNNLYQMSKNETQETPFFLHITIKDLVMIKILHLDNALSVGLSTTFYQELFL